MGYKREIRVRVADILAPKVVKPQSGWCGLCETDYCRHRLQNEKIVKAPTFYVMDSSIDKHLSIFIERKNIPRFIRKAGSYGMIWEKGLCIPVGNASKDWDALQVHIVTNEDCIDDPSTNEKSLDILDQYKN